MKHFHSVYFLFAICIVFSACVSGNSTVPPTLEARKPSTLPSFSPTLRPTVTSSPTQTITLTPPVTLEPNRAKDVIATLLRQPGECSKACFWGIIPGQTTLGEAKNIFTHLGLQFTADRTVEYAFDSGLSVSVTLRIQENAVVENLTINIAPEVQQSGTSREWLAYSPETLIQQYGSPSKVTFALDWGPRSFFDMVMYFDAVDLIVEYIGYDIIPRQKGSSQVCPLTARFDSVRLWMGKNPIYPPPEGVSLEKVTSLNSEQFSQLLTGDPSKACFIVKAEAFP